MSKKGYVYILTNTYNTVLYIGVTSNLEKREWEHRNKITSSFTNKYNINKLIYFELYNNIKDTITREKQLKRWHRDWKINLIKSQNPLFKNIMPTLKVDAETSSA